MISLCIVLSLWFDTRRRILHRHPRDAQQQARAHHDRDQRRSTEADERQRDARGREQIEHDRDIDQRLGDDPQCQARRQQGAEWIAGAARDLQPAHDQDDIQQHHEDRADHAQFFANDCKDAVGVRCGQKAIFLASLSQADARPAAVEEGDDRLLGVIVGGGQVGQAGEERRHAPLSIIKLLTENEARNAHRAEDAAQVPDVRASEEEHQASRHKDGCGGTDIRLRDHERADHADDEAEWNQTAPETRYPRPLRAEPCRHKNDDHQFREFAGLVRSLNERAARIEHIVTEHQHRDQAGNGEQQQQRRQPPPDAVIDEVRDQQHGETDAHVARVLQEDGRFTARRLVAPEKCGAVDHHRADCQQHHDHQQQRQIERG